MLRRPLESAQHASHAYRDPLTGAGITVSMSRKTDCYDNAPMESFFHTLKTELVHHRNYNTRAEAQRDIFAFIEDFYKRTKRWKDVPRSYKRLLSMKRSVVVTSTHCVFVGLLSRQQSHHAAKECGCWARRKKLEVAA